VLLVALGLVTTAGWLIGKPDTVQPPSAAAESQVVAEPPPERRASSEPEARSLLVTHTSSAAATVHHAPEAEAWDAHPHPITPKHIALQRELQLIAALNDALDLRDSASMRSVLADYRAHDPRDENALQAGYARLIECIDAPGEASREAGQAYYDANRASTLRRFIRRICLE